MVVAPALMAASTQRQRKSCSVRVASSADHSTSSVWLRARVTCATTISKTSCGSFWSLYFMCTGEVEMKVWMRLRLAGLMASAQRSMSLKAARERPQITEFFARLAISCTAAKSPSEAIGKPASMMSTPMASRSSATSSFSSCVMVAPGHCSPSRKVVSKMTTRSFSDFVWAVIGSIPSQFECATSGRSLRVYRGSPECPGAYAQPALRGG